MHRGGVAVQSRITNLIIKIAKELKNSNNIDENSYLFSTNDALFDSVGLIEFVVELEEALYDEFGKDISLSDEKAMSQSRSPFISIKTLSNYIYKSLNE